MNHKCQEAQVLLAPFSPTDIIPHRAGQQGKRQNLEVPEVAVKLNSRMHKKKTTEATARSVANTDGELY